MENVKKVCDFLDEVKTYYLATIDGDQARVRPFGTQLVYDGKLYIQTGTGKNVANQIAKNPKVEICAFDGNKWLRVAGKLVNDNKHEVKVAMLDKMPSLKAMYSPDNDSMQMYYFENATATFSSFTAAPETFNF